MAKRRSTNYQPTIAVDRTRSTTLSTPNSRAGVYQPGNNLMSPYYTSYPKVLGSGVDMKLASDGLKKRMRGLKWNI